MVVCPLKRGGTRPCGLLRIETEAPSVEELGRVEVLTLCDVPESERQLSHDSDNGFGLGLAALALDLLQIPGTDDWIPLNRGAEPPSRGTSAPHRTRAW